MAGLHEPLADVEVDHGFAISNGPRGAFRCPGVEAGGLHELVHERLPLRVGVSPGVPADGPVRLHQGHGASVRDRVDSQSDHPAQCRLEVERVGQRLTGPVHEREPVQVPRGLSPIVENNPGTAETGAVIEQRPDTAAYVSFGPDARHKDRVFRQAYDLAVLERAHHQTRVRIARLLRSNREDLFRVTAERVPLAPAG